jgi:hypothetical protein
VQLLEQRRAFFKNIYAFFYVILEEKGNPERKIFESGMPKTDLLNFRLLILG